MQKRANAVTFKGNPVTLVGPQLKPGDAAPDFTCLQVLDKVTLGQTPARVRVFSVVPSLDTAVCNAQTRKFDQQLAQYNDQVAAYTVSLDLPFAQKRFCDAEKVTNLTNLSDVHNHSFGQNWGVLIEGLPLPLLARAVFVVDKAGKIVHAEYVPEITTEPNYDATLAAIKSALG